MQSYMKIINLGIDMNHKPMIWWIRCQDLAHSSAPFQPENLATQEINFMLQNERGRFYTVLDGAVFAVQGRGAPIA